VEQLRSFAFLSGVLAGFAVASLLQLDFGVEVTKKSYQIWFALSAGLTASPPPPPLPPPRPAPSHHAPTLHKLLA